MRLPDHAIIVEVGPRDGLQDQKVFVPTEVKVRFLETLSGAGFRRIEATSFTHPRWIPPLRDADEVVTQLPRPKGLTWSALVPNPKGYERARAARIEEVTLVVSASDAHNRANLNRNTAESLQDFVALVQRACADGVRVRGAVAAAFGCPFEGEVPFERVQYVAAEFARMGVDEICLADTIGSGQPRQVNELFALVARDLAGIPLSAHFHDRRGFGMANVLAALDAGVYIFDSSVGGLGGCPYAPGAPGNIPTRQLVQFLEAMGVRTGIDLDAVEGAERIILEALG